MKPRFHFAISSKALLMKNKPRGRIEVHGDGISAVSDELLQQRARDLAQEDGRSEPRDADFKKAREELSGFTEDSAPEVPPWPWRKHHLAFLITHLVSSRC